MMTIKFSTHPGPRERQLIRKYQNPLFSLGHSELSQDLVDQAHEQDEVELNHFLRYFRDLVQEAIELKPNSDSETVLNIKQRLDRCYVHCCALPGDQSEIKTAVNKLVEVIMKAVRQGAANDLFPQNELEEEENARLTHNQLCDHLLVADLMLPDSPITEDELVATLLSEPEEAITAALQLFDIERISTFYLDAKTLLNSLKQQGHALPLSWKRLNSIEQVLSQLTSDIKLN